MKWLGGNGLPALKCLTEKLQGSRLLHGHYTALQKPIGTSNDLLNLKAVAETFIAERKANGPVRQLIGKCGVAGKLEVVG